MLQYANRRDGAVDLYANQKFDRAGEAISRRNDKKRRRRYAIGINTINDRSFTARQLVRRWNVQYGSRQLGLVFDSAQQRFQALFQVRLFIGVD